MCHLKDFFMRWRKVRKQNGALQDLNGRTSAVKFEELEIQKEDAMAMLNYATRNSLDVSQETIKDLIVWDPGKHGRDRDYYLRFLVAFSQISKLIAPATPESLRYVSEKLVFMRSRSIVVLTFAFFGYLMFLFVFFLQGYWFLVNGLVDNINSNVSALAVYDAMFTTTTLELLDKGKFTKDQITDEVVLDALDRKYFRKRGDVILAQVASDATAASPTVVSNTGSSRFRVGEKCGFSYPREHAGEDLKAQILFVT